MIHTSRQLKALVRNRSGGNSAKAQLIIRNYFVERLLERIAVSDYRNQIILKGGILIASLVGLDSRATMDMDTTIRGVNLSEQIIRHIIAEITKIPLDDSVSFEIVNIKNIMAEADYAGLRVMLNAFLENMKTPLKIDISTGDAITPEEAEYEYPLLFEERSIHLLAYNLETILAEKLETILARGAANTRMRDFYDICILFDRYGEQVDGNTLVQAVNATAERRHSGHIIQNRQKIMRVISNDSGLQKLWEEYQEKNDYARAYSWEEVTKSLKKLSSREFAVVK